MRFRIPALLIILSIVIYSCRKDDVTPPATENNPGTPSAPPASGSAIVFNVNKNVLLQLVNDVRKSGCKCGSTTMPPVAAVSWNDKLGQAAFAHSTDMSSNDYFSHTGLNGSNAGQRITAAGYIWRSYGENIAKGYASESAVMNGWLSSEGHCKNIMNAGFKEMGAGKQGSYWTQVFGSR